MYLAIDFKIFVRVPDHLVDVAEGIVDVELCRGEMRVGRIPWRASLEDYYYACLTGCNSFLFFVGFVGDFDVVGEYCDRRGDIGA